MNYTIEVINKNIFAIVIPDKYDRCMSFLKVAEYYESPDFAGKRFSIWDFIRWYTERSGTFSYVKDWDGANIPLNVFMDFCGLMFTGISKKETPYDDFILEIYDKILSYKRKNGYVIFTDSTEGDTFDHEMCHAKYHLDKHYRMLANELIADIDEYTANWLHKTLMRMGYSESVIADEIQAYLTTNYLCLDAVNIDDLVYLDAIEHYAKKFKEKLGKYIKK